MMRAFEKPVCEKCKDDTKTELIGIDRLNIMLCRECFEKSEQEIREKLESSGMMIGAMAFGNLFGPDEQNEENFLINLNEEVKDNFEPILFRDGELERVIQILLRKTKNNPVLIGEAGVGKTAIADLLAYEIVNNKIPRLKGYTVYSLNIAAFMSGTKFRGSFEEKFNTLISKLDSKSILFIDEMHLVMGAGGSEQSDIDLSNLLKPYLSKGKLKVIGATTLNEYRIIEKDPAFSRRFLPVKVKPLNSAQTLIVLQNIRSYFESHHGVEVLDESLKTIINLSDEYIHERYFPDKAIDVLDEACSLVSLEQNSIPVKEIKLLETELEQLVNTLDLKNAPDLKQKIAEAKKLKKVNPDHILIAVEKMTNIPVTQLTKEEKTRLKNLESTLKKRLIGQLEAIETLTKAVKRSRLKLKKIQKPTVLFFAGPTGVGKTESVKALAESLFGNEESMIRFDMSEYMEEHSLSKLIGSPPGYIGHEDEGQLTEKIRRNPYSIILLDEFEKAHTNITNLFLQLFDDGRLTDSKGRTIDFKNTIIILTSNIGVKEKQNVGFGSMPKETKTMEALEKAYPPEFLNRIDEIVTFKQLTEQDIIKIVDIRIKEYQESLKDKGIEFKIEQGAKSYLAKKGYSPTLGARPLARVITREIEDLIVDHILENDKPDSLVVTELEGKLQIS